MHQDDDRVLPFKRRETIVSSAAEANHHHGEPPSGTYWIDNDAGLTLYLEARKRAVVDRTRHLIDYFDPNGQRIATVVKLFSDHAFDSVEHHFGIEPVEDVRDECGEPGSAVSRAHEDDRLAEFTYHHSQEDEIFFYLRATARILLEEGRNHELTATAVEMIVAAISDAVRARFEGSLSHSKQTADILAPLEQLPTRLHMAAIHSRLAVAAIERLVDEQAAATEIQTSE